MWPIQSHFDMSSYYRGPWCSTLGPNAMKLKFLFTSFWKECERDGVHSTSSRPTNPAAGRIYTETMCAGDHNLRCTPTWYETKSEHIKYFGESWMLCFMNELLPIIVIVCSVLRAEGHAFKMKKSRLVSWARSIRTTRKAWLMYWENTVIAIWSHYYYWWWWYLINTRFGRTSV